MRIKSIASRIKEAERQNKKVAMLHFQILINADELRGFNAVKFCKEVGVKESYNADFNKILNLSQMIKEEGYVIKKV